MDHVWTVLCSLTVTDAERNNVTLVEVIEQVTYQSIATQKDVAEIVPIVCDLVSMWIRSEINTPEVQRGRTVLVGPSNEIIQQEEYEINLQSIQRLRLTTKIQGLPFVGNGSYHFLVEEFQSHTDSWLRVAKVPLYVSRLPSPFDEPLGKT